MKDIRSCSALDRGRKEGRKEKVFILYFVFTPNQPGLLYQGGLGRGSDTHQKKTPLLFQHFKIFSGKGMIFSIRKPQEKEIDAVEWNRRIREDAPRQTVELMADFFDLK